MLFQVAELGLSNLDMLVDESDACLECLYVVLKSFDGSHLTRSNII